MDDPDLLVIGGGPAGMMAGFLFARAGVRTLVLEKHGDFLRDFRGDTVHPSTMQILDELGLLRRFLERPHNRLDRAEVVWNGRRLDIGDLSHLAMPAPFIAMMPQWEFLDFIRGEAEALSTFALRMETEAVSFLEDAGRIVGATLADGTAIRPSRLVLACDGRTSIARDLLPLESLGVPIDVFWFSVPKCEPGSALRAAIDGSRMLVLIDRGEYWQCAFVIAKGGAEAIRARGIADFRVGVQAAAPDLSDIESALPDWDAVKLLSVSLDRLRDWSRPGLLAIGDAAHAMSPVGGVGINLAIQDAVATANLLAGPIAEGRSVDALLPRLERRRRLPTRLVQGFQQGVHERVLQPLLEGSGRRDAPPAILQLLDKVPLLRRIPGHFIGHGIRQEHVRSRLATS